MADDQDDLTLVYMFAFKKGEEAEREKNSAYVGRLQQKLAALRKHAAYAAVLQTKIAPLEQALSDTQAASGEKSWQDI